MRVRLIRVLVAATMAAGGALAVAGPAPAGPGPVPDFVFDEVGTFGGTVPEGVCAITVEAFGAQGGATSGEPALGGSATATIPVVEGQILEVNVGGQGFAGVEGGGAGGFNGGGTGGPAVHLNPSGGGGGGGASDVRLGGSALTDRVVVAGGGGGTASFGSIGAPFGAGGGLEGERGGFFEGDGGEGGTQSAGGAGGDGIFAGGPAADGTAGDLGTGGNGGSGFEHPDLEGLTVSSQKKSHGWYSGLTTLSNTFRGAKRGYFFVF